MRLLVQSCRGPEPALTGPLLHVPRRGKTHPSVTSFGIVKIPQPEFGAGRINPGALNSSGVVKIVHETAKNVYTYHM